MTSLPRHVAIIMDGNRRWAKARGLSSSEGHRAGVGALENIIRRTGKLGIPYLTVYAFSSENWSRSPSEVEGLMKLLYTFFTKQIDALVRDGVRVVVAGDVDGLPLIQREAVRATVARTSGNASLTLCICLNYGGRDETVRAARSLAEKAQRGEIDPASIDEAAFERELYTAGMPDVDLLIRTSGEQRLSGFLPWQASYAELVFSAQMWPDFTPDEYDNALMIYATRTRRFGGA